MSKILFQHATITKIIGMLHFLFTLSLQNPVNILYIYIYNDSQFGLTTFQGLYSHMYWITQV